MEGWMAERVNMAEKDVAHAVTGMNSKQRRKMRRSTFGGPTSSQCQHHEIKQYKSKRGSRNEQARLEKKDDRDSCTRVQEKNISVEDDISMTDKCATSSPPRSGMFTSKRSIQS
jgi:hypothetical protein